MFYFPFSFFLSTQDWRTHESQKRTHRKRLESLGRKRNRERALARFFYSNIRTAFSCHLAPQRESAGLFSFSFFSVSPIWRTFLVQYKTAATKRKRARPAKKQEKQKWCCQSTKTLWTLELKSVAAERPVFLEAAENYRPEWTPKSRRLSSCLTRTRLIDN